VEVLWPVGHNRSGGRERVGELKAQLRAFCPIMLPLARARAIDLKFAVAPRKRHLGERYPEKPHENNSERPLTEGRVLLGRF
jgi:hypothetical protein